MPSRNALMLIQLRDHPQGLKSELQGRRVTGRALFDKLIQFGQGFRYEDVSQGLQDKWGADNRRNNIVQAAILYGRTLGLDFDDRAGERFQDGEHPLNALTGAWIMVTLRGRRDNPSVLVPPEDYRTAILVYGDEADGNKKRFEIVGQKTFWKGEAKLLSQQIYYWAEEIKRTHVKEALAMIMFAVNTYGDIVHHHGASLSAAHGEFDGPDYPILASRISLYRSASLSKRLQTPLTEETMAKIAKQWCTYFTKKQFEQMKRQRGGIGREIYLAIESFRQHGLNRNNRGHRIFLRN